MRCCNLTVVKKSETLNLPFIPGVATPSEIETAHEKGYKLLKLFPAKVLGGETQITIAYIFIFIRKDQLMKLISLPNLFIKK
ncbi:MULTISPECIES: hypothetical protein [unclassified Endozoicomonas]|uniref:hypothetical protein n=1 Tax=unclassified Endozoicomonas TaxID=2644528 RepID=UPI0021498574|nr:MULTISPECIES: hypothetical protein [unclassified Endozoicomonas]